MSILGDWIKRLFVNPRQARLVEAKRMREDTIPLILIETLEYILKDDDGYKRFKKLDPAFFKNEIILDDYKKAFNDYAQFFIRRGVTFNKKELKRIQKITGKKYKDLKGKKNDSPEMEDLVGECIRDPAFLEQFKNINRNFSINGIHVRDIQQKLLTTIDALKVETEGLYSSRLNSYKEDVLKDGIKRGDPFLGYAKEKNSPDLDINKQLEELEQIVDKDEVENVYMELISPDKYEEALKNFEI